LDARELIPDLNAKGIEIENLLLKESSHRLGIDEARYNKVRIRVHQLFAFFKLLCP